MILKKISIIAILILGAILVFNQFRPDTTPVKHERLMAFIEKENVQDPVIIPISQSNYYIFSQTTNSIYTYEGNGNSHSSHAVPRNGIVFGGLEKGAFGLIINNQDILEQASQYRLTIDGKSKTYDYHREVYLVVQDSRIWNPVPQVTIEFLNDNGKRIAEETF